MTKPGTRTNYRALRLAYIIKIQELLGFAVCMKRQDVEKMDLPVLKNFFYFLHENLKIDRLVLKNFYKLSEKERSIMLTEDEENKEGEVF